MVNKAIFIGLAALSAIIPSISSAQTYISADVNAMPNRTQPKKIVIVDNKNPNLILAHNEYNNNVRDNKVTINGWPDRVNDYHNNYRNDDFRPNRYQGNYGDYGYRNMRLIGYNEPIRINPRTKCGRGEAIYKSRGRIFTDAVRMCLNHRGQWVINN